MYETLKKSLFHCRAVLMLCVEAYEADIVTLNRCRCGLLNEQCGRDVRTSCDGEKIVLL